MTNTIELVSYNWTKHRYQIDVADDATDFQRMMFEHCSQCFDNPDRINDSQQNRDLMTNVLRAHNFTEIVFLDELPN